MINTDFVKEIKNGQIFLICPLFTPPLPVDKHQDELSSECHVLVPPHVRFCFTTGLRSCTAIRRGQAVRNIPTATWQHLKHFSNQHVTKNDEKPTPGVPANKTNVMVYFSARAQWYPPCGGHTPQLSEAHAASEKAGKQTGLIFVSQHTFASARLENTQIGCQAAAPITAPIFFLLGL